MRLFTRHDFRAAEAAALKLGATTADMAEGAGKAAFDFICSRFCSGDAVVPVLCGAGDAGAKALAVARLLKTAGANPLAVLCCGTPERATPSAMYRRAVMEGVPVADLAFDFERISKAVPLGRVIVDGVFGLGYEGGMGRDIEKLFDAVNASGCAVVSLELPSGLNADTGTADEHALRADVTVCFTGLSPAHVMLSGREHCGEMLILNGGAPPEAADSVPRHTALIDRDLARSLIDPKPIRCHKGDMGKLAAAVGSPGYRGAAVLAAKGAYAAGAGLVTVASDERVLAAVAAAVPEAVFLDLAAPKPKYAGLINSSDAALIGCGMAAGESTEALVCATIRNAECPLVIDGGGITSIAGRIDILSERKGPTVLTPHPGEFARMLGVTVDEILADRIRLAREFSESCGITLVLKSENTVVADSGRVFINNCGNSGLAKAGSGDLLAGMIGALAAMGKSALDASILGVFLHSTAADITAMSCDRYSVTASMVADAVPGAFASLFN